MSYPPPIKKAFAKHDLYKIEEPDIDFNDLYAKKAIPKITVEKVLSKGCVFYYYEDDGLWYDDGSWGFQTRDYNWISENLTEPEDITSKFNIETDKDLYDVLECINFIMGNNSLMQVSKDKACDWLEWRTSLDFGEITPKTAYKKNLYDLAETAIEKYREG